MKKNNFTKIGCLVFGLISLLQTTTLAQKLNIDKIDTSNYYDYNIFNSGNQKYLKGKQLMGHFLKRPEAIHIITDELLKTEHNVQVNTLYKLDNNQYINLDVYDLDKDIGYIYVEIVKGGGQEMRRIKSPYLESHNADYVQIVRAKGGEMIEANVIKTLPNNIKIIWAEWYWFQYTENKEDNKYFITKEIITKILRQDIRNIINAHQ